MCTVCNGAEGTLPTECPGRLMSSARQEHIYAGRIDFKDGEWIKGISPCCPVPDPEVYEKIGVELPHDYDPKNPLKQF